MKKKGFERADEDKFITIHIHSLVLYLNKQFYKGLGKNIFLAMNAMYLSLVFRYSVTLDIAKVEILCS